MKHTQWREQLGIVFTFDSINLTLLTCHQHISALFTTPFTLARSTLAPLSAVSSIVTAVTCQKNKAKREGRTFRLYFHCIHEYKQFFFRSVSCLTTEGLSDVAITLKLFFIVLQLLLHHRERWLRVGLPQLRETMRRPTDLVTRNQEKPGRNQRNMWEQNHF